MAVEKILTHKNGVAEYIITSAEDLKELVDVEVGSRARLLSPVEVRDYIYCGKWAEVKREDSCGDNEIEGIIDDINGEIMDNAVEIVNEYHKNLDSLVDCTVTEFEGRDIMINPSIEGKTKSIVIKGETYQNLLNNFSISDEYSKYITANGNTIKWTKTEVTTSGINIKYHNSLAQLNRAYTLIFYIYKNTLQKEGLEGSYNVAKFNIVSYNDGCYHIPINKTGLVKVKLIQPTTIPSDGKPYLEVFKDSVGEFEISYPILLEGDYTDDDKIPSQFEGIVGVGDTLSQPYGTHKIEILSCGKNLLNLRNTSKTYGGLNFVVNNNVVKASGTVTNNTGTYDDIIVPIGLYPISNGNQVISAIGKNDSNIIYQFLVSNESGKNIYSGGYSFKSFNYKIPSGYRLKKIRCLLRTLDAVVDDEFTFQLEESPVATEYQPYQEDKTQILLDEPLMKLPSGVCDILEQRDDGVYLVKRVGKFILDDNTGSGLINGLITNENYSIFRLYPKDFTLVRKEAGLISDKFSYYKFDGGFRRDSIGEAISDGGGYRMLYLRILNSRLSTVDSDGLKDWLSKNPTTVYYGLTTPIETKLDIPTANITTFKDVTHISTTNEIKPIINVTLDTTNISKDANQYFSIENNKNFILPNMDDIENNSIKELNLYMDIKGEYTLTFPSDIKWSSNVINLNKADYMSILLKYIKVNDVGLWLGNIRGIDKEE